MAILIVLNKFHNSLLFASHINFLTFRICMRMITMKKSYNLDIKKFNKHDDCNEKSKHY